MAFGIDRQFLWGPGLMITPVLEQGQTSVQGYFPIGPQGTDRWFSYYDVSKMKTTSY